jgi:hypothetical protein
MEGLAVERRESSPTFLVTLSDNEHSCWSLISTPYVEFKASNMAYQMSVSKLVAADANPTEVCTASVACAPHESLLSREQPLLIQRTNARATIEKITEKLDLRGE